jgi:hypothetical protein
LTQNSFSLRETGPGVKEIFEGEIIGISHRAVIPRISLRIPEFHRNSRNSKKNPGIKKKIQEFQWNFMQIYL